ncbi:MAG: FAD-dependent oxidoreductase [Verrucomicrobiae bacterium]|nr:FAD-dependent oxidoreductase [Verrucomicrobiae bacterium]
MTSDSGDHGSLWEQNQSAGSLSRSPLERDEKADVCVVGAGIAGLSVAYQLSRAGLSVVVLEDGSIGGGETGHTTAHLSNAWDDRYSLAEAVHGERGAALIAESHTAAIDEIERTVIDEGIRCDFLRLDGFLFPHPGEDPDALGEELEAAHRAGLSGVEWLDALPLIDFPVRQPCLRFPSQGQFHPLRYLSGLADAIQRRGGKIFTGAHAAKISAGAPCEVGIESGPIVRAQHVVVATNSPVHLRFAMHTKQSAYRTYAIGARVSQGAIPRGLYWETGSPYHYVRLQPRDDADARGSEILIVGGEDHKTGQAADDEQFVRLEAWMRLHFPKAGEVEFRWSGQVMETVDGAAYIGRSPDDERLLLVTGDSGMGMTHGTIAGLLLADLIQGRDHPWASLYDPSRKSLRASGEFLKENLNVAKRYGDRLKGGTAESVDAIDPGQGAILRVDGRQLAVYRDRRGELQACTAICPHLGCVVQWNHHERSWDCPCHGSRFDPHGRVLNGPANQDLDRESPPARGEAPALSNTNTNTNANRERA